MRLLLDTNVLLWTLAGSPRVADQRERIESGDNEVHVSAATWWEIAIKIGIGKLDVDLAALRRAARESGFAELAVQGTHAQQLLDLPPLHKDPFDRMLVAQAMAEPMRLLTSDALLTRYADIVELV
jgi:PIN domain nuclease of toxin-antitoxin system